MKTSQVLKSAKQYIQDHGWTRLTFERDNGAVCALGALAHITLHEDPAREALIRAIPSSLILHSVSAYNDYVCKDLSDVEEWFDRAIALAEEDEYGQPIEDTNNGVGEPGPIQRSSDLVVTT